MRVGATTGVNATNIVHTSGLTARSLKDSLLIVNRSRARDAHEQTHAWSEPSELRAAQRLGITLVEVMSLTCLLDKRCSLARWTSGQVGSAGDASVPARAVRGRWSSLRGAVSAVVSSLLNFALASGHSSHSRLRKRLVRRSRYSLPLGQNWAMNSGKGSQLKRLRNLGQGVGGSELNLCLSAGTDGVTLASCEADAPSLPPSLPLPPVYVCVRARARACVRVRVVVFLTRRCDRYD